MVSMCVIYHFHSFDYGYEDDEDDIPLPPGLPPGSEDVTSDDDIPMPEGPRPGQEPQAGTEDFTYRANLVDVCTFRVTTATSTISSRIHIASNAFGRFATTTTSST